jgi:hypothetical protein
LSPLGYAVRICGTNYCRQLTVEQTRLSDGFIAHTLRLTVTGMNVGD